jgi:hypothetical protein
LQEKLGRATELVNYDPHFAAATAGVRDAIEVCEQAIEAARSASV